MLYNIKQYLAEICRQRRYVPVGRMFCYLLLIVVIVEFLLFNLLMFYVYRFVSNELSQIPFGDSDGTFLSRLSKNSKIRSLIRDAKDGGFVSILQDTLERLYIVKETNGKKVLHSQQEKLPLKEMFTFGLDVSHSREATFIYKRIFSRNEFPYEHIIVDIGANDGFLSSNSFNFIQLGWDAVLVEPQILQINAAKKNLKRYIEVNREPPQMVHFVQAVLGSHEGTAYLHEELETQETHVLSLNDPRLRDDQVIQVPSITVKTLAYRYSIPKNFSILSIDAEGMGFEILHQWFELKFTPAYIIFEIIHIEKPLPIIAALMKRNDYKYIGTRGWNIIYEHITPSFP